MKGSLLHSLLELAHATSQNLGFAHRPDVSVSYGEETITETNLLELRRRHPKIITLNTFGKKAESQNGADWEWHIIGRAREFRMRVQAKRLQKNGVLKIPHKIKSSGKEQIDLLIDDAKTNRLKPVYCIYSAEDQRTHWKKGKSAIGNLDMFEAGCLLADAHLVKNKMPKKLTDIEKDCVPWHYLAERKDFGQVRTSTPMTEDEGLMRFAVSALQLPVPMDRDQTADSISAQSFPTLDELNAKSRPTRDISGLVEASDIDGGSRRSEREYRERGIARVLKIDVREFPPSPEDGSDD